MTSPTVLVLHGPNQGLLGLRQPHIYGTTTLAEIIARLTNTAQKHGVHIEHLQSNHEGDLVSCSNDHYRQLKTSSSGLRGIIINAGAYTHTSIAIRDALDMFTESHIPIYEVHLSNIYRREPFRHHSFISAIATGVICGCGVVGYDAALQAILNTVDATK